MTNATCATPGITFPSCNSLPANARGVSSLELDVTMRCNLKCSYCFREDKRSADLTLELGKRAIDWLLLAAEGERIPSVVFFGGEPLLKFDLIKDMVIYGKRKARQLGRPIHFSMTTNATLITTEVMEFFKSYGIGVLLSIDGCPASHDRYRSFPNGKPTSQLVEENAKIVLAHQSWAIVRWTIMPDTVQYMGESIRYFADMGFKKMSFEAGTGADWNAGALDALEKGLEEVAELWFSEFKKGNAFHVIPLERPLQDLLVPGKRRKHHCGAGIGLVHMDAEGNLYPCHRWKEPVLRQRYRLGHINEGFDHAARQRFIDFRLDKDMDAPCLLCETRPICTSFCIAAGAAANDGDMCKPEPIQCESLRYMCRTQKALLARVQEEGLSEKVLAFVTSK